MPEIGGSNPRDRILDIGCGWGGLHLYVAQTGALVHGITLSRRQAEVANHRITAADVSALPHRSTRLSGRAWRSIVRQDHQHRHGGARDGTGWRPIMNGLWGLLSLRGVFLNQGIGTRDGEPALGAFAQRYVFPDAELVPIQDTCVRAESCGFEVRASRVYGNTMPPPLDAWGQRLERHHQEALRAVGEVTYRVWRAYMAMAAYPVPPRAPQPLPYDLCESRGRA